MARNVTLTLELPEEEAYALAELAKRITWGDTRSLAVSDAEAYNMLYATDRVRVALSEAGVSVR